METAHQCEHLTNAVMSRVACVISVSVSVTLTERRPVLIAGMAKWSAC